MVTLKTIPTNYLGPAINFSFKGDGALIHTYHLVTGNLTDCVKNTYQQIDKVAKEGTRLDYYGVFNNDDLIGFTVTGPKILLSFGINIQYRTKEIVLDWWHIVCDLLGHEFVTWLFKKNLRAIDFLQRNGMEILEDHGDYVTLVHYAPDCIPQKQQRCQQVD